MQFNAAAINAVFVTVAGAVALFVAAVAACGALLAEHLPATGENPNRLPDVLIEI